jgi:hypothetical protein
MSCACLDSFIEEDALVPVNVPALEFKHDQHREWEIRDMQPGSCVIL